MIVLRCCEPWVPSADNQQEVAVICCQINWLVCQSSKSQSCLVAHRSKLSALTLCMTTTFWSANTLQAAVSMVALED